MAQSIDYTLLKENASLKYQLLINDGSTQWKMVENALGNTVENNINYLFVKKEDTYYFTDKLLRKKVLVKENPTFKWELENETKEILGYTCHSAVTTFKGRKYKVYYAPEIKLKEGPWKFHGLDGLILRAESEDGIYVFEATKINMNPPKIDEEFINKSLQRDFISWKEYEKAYIESVDEFIENEKCNCSKDGTNRIKISKIEKVYPNLEEGIIY